MLGKINLYKFNPNVTTHLICIRQRIHIGHYVVTMSKNNINVYFDIQAVIILIIIGLKNNTLVQIYCKKELWYAGVGSP